MIIQLSEPLKDFLQKRGNVEQLEAVGRIIYSNNTITVNAAVAAAAIAGLLLCK
jgi:hypothetical protein